MPHSFSVTVFCGAKPGHHSSYMSDARRAGELIAERGWRLVYGGGSNGLMGACADGALSRGGAVLGIITQHLVSMEVAHRALTELKIVGDMALRKQRLIDEGDAFLVLPGGMGTLDEVFEVVTLGQLGLLSKPVVFYNPAGFYDALQAFVTHQMAEGFVRPQDWNGVKFADHLPVAIQELERLAAARKSLLAPSLIDRHSHSV